MKSHELADYLLYAPDSEIKCSVNLGTNEDGGEDYHCFGTFFNIGELPVDKDGKTVLLFNADFIE